MTLRDLQALSKKKSDDEPSSSSVKFTSDGGRILGNGWVEYYNEEYQKPFYVNEATDETVWELPAELMSLLLTNDNANEDRQILAVHFGDELQEFTDGSSSDEEEPQMALAGGTFNDEESKRTATVGEKGLSESSQAMLSKLNSTRAAQQGDLQGSQAANNASGMLMLESIQNKDDPTAEKADDEEIIARFANERVKAQEDAEKIRNEFTDLELFHLREEFNNVDADRSGYIDDDELKVLLTLMNDSKVPTESEVRRIMESADTSGDGQLDFIEFLELVKGLRAEKKANKSFFKSIGKMIDTVKTDVFGDTLKEISEYKTRAYRWIHAEKIAKAERREAEKQRLKAQREAELAKQEHDRQLLADEDQKREEQAARHDEPTGLDTTVLFEGNGVDFPEDDDNVSVHIKMMIPNGKGPNGGHEVLENSRKRRRPFKFKLDGGAVIPGLAIVIPKLSLGTKVRVVVPPELAYGERGLTPKVPPNTTLLLEVELLSFEVGGEEDTDD